MADTSSTPPGQASPGSQPKETQAGSPVVVKKYANRRLYNTETSSYITLDNLAEMIRAGRDFAVYDAKSGEDITRGVLTQIIVEEESKGTAMLPTAFLRQLIGFYGGSLQGVVPRYLEHAMTSFARQQQQLRHMLERSLSPFLPTGVEEMNRQNMAMFERAVSMWNPFHRTNEQDGGAQPHPAQSEPAQSGEASALTGEERAELERLRQGWAELDRLRQEIESLRQQLAAAHAAAALPQAATAVVPPNAPENVLADEGPADPAELANGAARGQRRPARKAAAGTAG